MIAGKYRVERVIGEGGMGLVVAAMHLQLEERVAIKLLLPEAVRNPEVVGRFLREARAAVKIKSEHVARVSDVGSLDDGTPYMVMEMLVGSDLSDVLRDRGPLPVSDVAEWISQACEALAEAHAIGIVHRDLKPSNLFLTRRADGSPCVKVLDFGISKMTGKDEKLGMTRTAAIMGSPLYMSPEQMKSTKDVDLRTDVWSLGTILYELLSGKPPFDGESVAQICALVMSTTPTPLSQSRPECAGIDEVVRTCLERDPALRYQNVGDLCAALSAFSERARLSADRTSQVLRSAGFPLLARASQASVPYPPAKSEPAKSDLAETRTAPAEPRPGALTEQTWGETTDAPPPRSRSRTALVVALAVAASAILGGAGTLWVYQNSESRTDASGAVAAATIPAPPPSTAAPVASATDAPRVEPAPTVVPAVEPAESAAADPAPPPAPTQSAAAKRPPPPVKRPAAPPPNDPPAGPKPQKKPHDPFGDDR